MLSAIPDSESTPPLYYVVAWFWTQLFGTGEIGVRSLSALAGVATIPVAYAIGARALSARTGLIAAALVAANPLLVWYSQEARAYALLVLLTALTILAMQRIAERPSAGRLAAWAALAAAAIATHYFAAFVVVPEAAWLLWRLRRRALAPLAGVAVVSLALLPMAIGQAENDRASFIRGESVATRAVSLPKQFLVGYDAPGEVIATVVAALLGLFAVYVAVSLWRDEEKRAAAPLAALAGIGIGVPLVLSLGGADYLITRNVLPALVPLLVVGGIAFGAARAGRAGIAAAAGLALVGVAMCVGVAANDVYQRDDWREAAAKLGRPFVRRVLVVSPGNGTVPLEVYLPGARVTRRDEHPAVQEIDVVAFEPRGFGAEANPPRAPNPPALPGFGFVRRIESETYTLVTYRAAQPRAFPDPPLFGIALGGAKADIMVQEALRP
jgi:hypothetical protein